MVKQLAPLVAGALGGILSWFVTQFVAEPLRRFLGMRREIVQQLLDCENVRARRNDKDELVEDFTEEDAARLRDAQSKLRQLGTQILSFTQTDIAAKKIIGSLWGYDPEMAGTSLMTLSHDIAIYGLERQRQRENILIALRIKALPSRRLIRADSAHVRT
jgi:hypothetical protein